MGLAMMVVQLEIPDGWEDSLLVGTVDTSMRGPLAYPGRRAWIAAFIVFRTSPEARRRVQA